MIELAPISDSELRMAELEFSKWLPEAECGMDNIAAELHREVSEGFINSVGVKRSRKLYYTIFYHVTPSKILYINGVQRMRPDATIETALSGLEILAKHNGCEFISGSVRRSGFVKILQQRGYKSIGVLLMKSVSNGGQPHG